MKKKVDGATPQAIANERDARLTVADVDHLLDRIRMDYDITDAPGELVLSVLHQALTRALAARAVLDRDGPTTRDARNRPRPHPAASVERDMLRLALSALRALNLDIEPPRPGPGRPPGGRAGGV
jgi:hypothetical protein